MTPQIKLRNAKISLLFREPFLATLLCGLKMVEDKTGICKGTMATDGVHLYWDANFVNELTEGALKTVLCHESMHCGLLHMCRRGLRDPYGWNIAADHATNLILEACNEEAKAKGNVIPFEWPEGALKDPRYKGMSTEAIYAQLPRLPQPGGAAGKGKGSGTGKQPSPKGGMGDVLDAGSDPAQRMELEGQWKQNLMQAAEAARMQGKLPAGMARLVDELINPPTPWRDILRRFITAKAKDDYSWTRPNMRYAHTGFILPSLYSQRMGRIVVVIDTSGSIDAKLLNAFMAEVESICHECRPEKIVLIDCDAAVHSVTEHEATDPLPKDFKGGGGTSFIPALMEACKHEAACVVYLTDLHGDFPEQEPLTPVIWAATNDRKAPFGVTVKIECIHDN